MTKPDDQQDTKPDAADIDASLHTPKIRIIAAVNQHGIIGESVSNSIPWHHPKDLERFRELTEGHVVIMGRKTFESIGRPLPRRHNVVLTYRAKYQLEQRDLAFASDFEEALRVAKDICAGVEGVPRSKHLGPTPDIWLIGGWHVYDRGLKCADEMYLTRVPNLCPAQRDRTYVYFPKYDSKAWAPTGIISLSDKPRLVQESYKRRSQATTK